MWFGVSRGRSEPVKVFAFNSVGMTEYWGDSQESYGPVSTDKIQTVFLSSTQTVTEMKVAQGDTVKKGDVLMTFDTTLSDLQLERKRLEVEKLKLDLETAQKKLKDIQNMKPMSIVSPDDLITAMRIRMTKVIWKKTMNYPTTMPMTAASRVKR